MNRGRWTIVAILAVAVIMGIATGPLLRIRRLKDIRRTEQYLDRLIQQCREYRQSHDRYPETLGDLKAIPARPVDAWGRPIDYLKWCPGWQVVRIEFTSQGPDPDDPADDIHRQFQD